MKKSLLWTTQVRKPYKNSLIGRSFLRAITSGTVFCFFIGMILFWIPRASEAQGVHPSTPDATCRDSRLLPKSTWPLDEEGKRHLRLEADVDGDGLADVLEATYSSGSGFSSTEVQITLAGSGDKLKAEETFDFSGVTAVTLVPKELLDPRHHAALKLIEEALFPRICESPDPSLAWLLDTTKRLTWIEGPPKMPDFYAIRLPVHHLTGVFLKRLKEAEGTIDPNGAVWITYAGHVHAYPGRDGRAKPVVLAQEGDQVLLGTAHGVILTNPERSKHAWICVFQGDDEVKLRFPSIAGARLQGDTAIITLVKSLPDSDSPPTESEKSKQPQVQINLKTGSISK